MIGRKFNQLTVIKESNTAKSGIYYECICDCGETSIVKGGNLRSGNTKTCGHSKATDEVGNTYGKLTVIQRVKEPAKYKDCRTAAYFECLCECGNTIVVKGFNLRNGGYHSCGCINVHEIHGKTYSKEYYIWSGMLQRCSNPKYNEYHRYGGRGITVCKRWSKFKNFYEDMGDVPSGMSIDRINNDLGYYSENCKWSTCSEQAQNSSNAKLDATKVLDIRKNYKLYGTAHFAKKYGVSKTCILRVVNRESWKNIEENI